MREWARERLGHSEADQGQKQHALVTATMTSTKKLPVIKEEEEKSETCPRCHKPDLSHEIQRTRAETKLEAGLDLNQAASDLEKANRRLEAMDAEAANLRAENRVLKEELHIIRSRKETTTTSEQQAQKQTEADAEILSLRKQIVQLERTNKHLASSILYRRTRADNRGEEEEGKEACSGDGEWCLV